MFEKLAESKNESSNRRRFLHRILGLGAAAGAASLLLNSDKSLVPLAQAGSGTGTNVEIDYWNYGVSSTTIESNVNSCAFRAKNTYPGGSAMDGWASAATGSTIAVYGLSESIDGKGIFGHAINSTGSNYGVYGQSDSVSGRGVYGKATASTGENYGVYGLSNSINGTGVYGTSTSGGQFSYGVQGVSENGKGVFGIGKEVGVHGISSGIGVLADADFNLATPLVARGFSGIQTANLQEWQNGIPSVLSVINCLGYLGVGTNSPSTPIHVKSSSSNPAVRLENEGNHVGQFIYCYSNGNIPFFSGRRARGTIASPSAVQTDDVLMRYGGSGYGSTTFPPGNRAILEFKAAEAWTDTAQGTYITMQTTPTGSNAAAERMRITDAGEIVPPTDNTGSIGTASKRWSLVRATTVTSGDLVFENSFIVTEDEKVGLAFKNDAGEKIAVLDREGNLRVKGKVIEGL